jgi:MarR family 2-MHQ and catechol resistance regulon transcriptional repressor
MNPTKKYGKKTTLALDLWVKLARAFNTFNKQADDHIRTAGLTMPQFAVLECLGHLGAMPIGELCKKMLVSGGNMTVVLDNLQKDGLIERIRSTDDRRSTLVRLTAKGQKRFQTFFPTHAAVIAQTASPLTEREQTELARLLKKLGLGIQSASPPSA